MPRRNWKKFTPTSLPSAIEGCIHFALDKHNRSVEQVAELMGLTSRWTLYKWMESGKLPANMITPFEFATGANFVSQWLATRGGRIVIDIPRGRTPSEEDTLAVQEACNTAIREIIRFAKSGDAPENVIAAITPALQQLAFQQRNAEKHTQPELDL